MNLLLFPPGSLDAQGLLTVEGTQHKHLVEVLEAGVGDRVRVGEIGGLIGDGLVEHLDPKTARLRCQLHSPPPPKLPLTIILALPRPKMLRRILRAVAEFGVAELYLVNSYRVEKSFWQTPVLEAETVENYLLQGLEQCRDTVLPAVHQRHRFKPFVEDELPALLEGSRGLLAHPGDHPPCPRDLTQKTVLAIGPEGGWIPYEVEKLEEAGCRTVSLGERILRVEDALVSLIGRLA